MSNVEASKTFLSVRDDNHLAVNFTMELTEKSKHPFQNLEIIKHMSRLGTKVYEKPTDIGLLHYQSS